MDHQNSKNMVGDQDIIWLSDIHTLSDIINKFTLPVLVKVEDGYMLSEEDCLETDTILTVHGQVTMTKVAAVDQSHKSLSIPVACPHKLRVRPYSDIQTFKTIHDICKIIHLPTCIENKKRFEFHGAKFPAGTKFVVQSVFKDHNDETKGLSVIAMGASPLRVTLPLSVKGDFMTVDLPCDKNCEYVIGELLDRKFPIYVEFLPTGDSKAIYGPRQGAVRLDRLYETKIVYATNYIDNKRQITTFSSDLQVKLRIGSVMVTEDDDIYSAIAEPQESAVDHLVLYNLLHSDPYLGDYKTSPYSDLETQASPPVKDEENKAAESANKPPVPKRSSRTSLRNPGGRCKVLPTEIESSNNNNHVAASEKSYKAPNTDGLSNSVNPENSNDAGNAANTVITASINKPPLPDRSLRSSLRYPEGRCKVLPNEIKQNNNVSDSVGQNSNDISNPVNGPGEDYSYARVTKPNSSQEAILGPHTKRENVYEMIREKFSPEVAKNRYTPEPVPRRKKKPETGGEEYTELFLPNTTGMVKETSTGSQVSKETNAMVKSDIAPERDFGNEEKTGIKKTGLGNKFMGKATGQSVSSQIEKKHSSDHTGMMKSTSIEDPTTIDKKTGSGSIARKVGGDQPSSESNTDAGSTVNDSSQSNTKRLQERMPEAMVKVLALSLPLNAAAKLHYEQIGVDTAKQGNEPPPPTTARPKLPRPLPKPARKPASSQSPGSESPSSSEKKFPPPLPPRSYSKSSSSLQNQNQVTEKASLSPIESKDLTEATKQRIVPSGGGYYSFEKENFRVSKYLEEQAATDVVLEEIHSMDQDQVCKMLDKLRLSEFSDGFKADQIDGSLLADIEEDDLISDIEMSKFQARKLWLHIRGWKPDEEGAGLGPEDFDQYIKWTVDEVNEKLKSINLNSFADFCVENQVNGALLGSILDKDVLQSIRVEHDVKMSGIEERKLSKFVLTGWRPGKAKK